MFLAFVIIEIGILIVILCLRFVTSDGTRGNPIWQRWLHAQGIALMLVAILPGHSSPWRFHHTLFGVGAVAFLITMCGWPHRDKTRDKSGHRSLL